MIGRITFDINFHEGGGDRWQISRPRNDACKKELRDRDSADRDLRGCLAVHLLVVRKQTCTNCLQGVVEQEGRGDTTGLGYDWERVRVGSRVVRVVV